MKVCVKKMIVGPVGTNCYLVYREGSEEAVIIDPGDDAAGIEYRLYTLKLRPVMILLTHGHFDHIGAVNELKEQYKIPVVCDREEEKILMTDMNMASLLDETMRVKADRFLTDGETVTAAGLEFQMIHTPGHTIGSCCYLLKNEKILFSGDTLFYHSYGRTDFPTGSQSQLMRSIVSKLMVLEDDIVVYPGHEEETTIGNERKIYDYYSF